MKKYTDKHLESVPADFILALKKMLYIDIDDVHIFCPVENYCDVRYDELSEYLRDGNYGPVCVFCPIVFDYIKISIWCPCSEFGENKAIAMAKNLITQWEKWAQIDD